MYQSAGRAHHINNTITANTTNTPAFRSLFSAMSVCQHSKPIKHRVHKTASRLLYSL